MAARDPVFPLLLLCFRIACVLCHFYLGSFAFTASAFMPEELLVSQIKDSFDLASGIGAVGCISDLVASIFAGVILRPSQWTGAQTILAMSPHILMAVLELGCGLGNWSQKDYSFVCTALLFAGGLDFATAICLLERGVFAYDSATVTNTIENPQHSQEQKDNQPTHEHVEVV
ncbi:hypothetical protein NPX13_g10222 [Xylaria arbuscula]|uniref:Uncharacterized protein n=1 Tax=Xylaria arbuscula TaxID=114810 RepID=A0A9W8N562_9PEZI|nr:hypothetical protein NPX13_g10222 [Xylaria arbuscula]